MNTDFLLVGGGCGGLETAIHLRKLVANATITIVNPQPNLFYRPWLIYLPAQRRRVEELQVSLEKAADVHQFQFIMNTVRQVDLANQCAILDTGERIHYRYVVLATGAPADRKCLPGAAEHAIFPCDIEEALLFKEKFLNLKQGHVFVIASGERPGPGLEYAGWLATAAYERRSTNKVQVSLIDDRDSLRARFGDKAVEVIARFFAQRGAQLVIGQTVRAVHAREIELESGLSWDSALTAVVGPLHGTDLALPAPIVNERGFVRVKPTFQSEYQSGLFAVGDALQFPDGSEVSKSWMLTRQQAPLVAQNVAALANGQDLKTFDIEKVQKAGMLVPDCGGQAVMVKNGRLLASGRWPLVLRNMIDQRYLKARR